MLQKIRDNSQGVISKVLLGLLIGVFALFGIDTIVGTYLVSTPTLTVNGEEINTQEIDNLAQRKAQEVLAEMGENADFSQFNEAVFREAAVNELIQRELINQSADNSDMGISSVTIDRRIAQTQDFQVDGRFNAERANLMLQSMGYTPAGYRNVLAQDLILNQILSAYTATGFATPDQVAQLAALTHQKRSFRFVAVPASVYTDTVTVSDDEIASYYQNNQAMFQQEEQVSIEYLELNKQTMMAEVAVTEEQLQAAYQEEVASYQAQTERRASHILWEATSAEELAAARTEAESVKARLDAGEDFATLAAEFSDDTGSAASGGDVGYTTGDSFVEAFETALRDLELDQVSAPTQTEFGIHLIKLTELSETSVESFEMRREALERDIKQREVDELFSERVDELSNLAFESVDLEEPARQLNLTKQTSELFGRTGGAGVTAEQAVITAAFSAEVMDDGLNSDVINVDADRSIVLRVLNHQPAEIKPLDVVRGEVEIVLRQDKARQQAAALGESFVTGLQGGSNIDGLLATQNLSWNQIDNIERVAPNLNPEITDLVFTMERPEQGETSIAGFSVSNGDYLVIELQTVTDGTPADFTGSEEQNMRNFLSQQTGVNDLTGFVKSMEARADIEGRDSQLEVQDPLL
jgi:peptidyl-prolyl cis-trans isomerase D